MNQPERQESHDRVGFKCRFCWYADMVRPTDQERVTIKILPGNPTDKGAWWATVHRVAKSRTRLNKGVCTSDTNR